MELSSKGRTYANMVGEAYFGFNFDEAMLKIQHWQEERKEALRKVEESKRKEEEAKRETEEAKRKEEEAIQQKQELLQKQEKQILNFYYDAHLSKEQIAQFMELELDFITDTIAKKEAE